MIEMKEDSKVYVACPNKIISGGPETLHQLVDKLRSINIDAYIYYFDVDNIETNDLVSQRFKKYNIRYVTKINDSIENVLIIPEVYTKLLYKFKKIQKGIWWLSYDFYYKLLIKNRSELALKKRRLPLMFKPFLELYFIVKEHGYKQFQFDKDTNKYFHIYNCEYIKQILLKNGVKEEKTLYLCGPIGQNFLENYLSEKNKENIVVYNPTKGYSYTIKIIDNIKKIDDNIKFLPLKDLTPDGMAELLKKSKVYIDFGFFPGPERIPREAVSCYCNLVTSNCGSANNDVDVLIPKEFKFSPIDDNIKKISELIIDEIYNYSNYVKYFDDYREKVKMQPDIFNNNIKLLFS